jgi:hypothetical protein
MICTPATRTVWPCLLAFNSMKFFDPTLWPASEMLLNPVPVRGDLNLLPVASGELFHEGTKTRLPVVLEACFTHVRLP